MKKVLLLALITGIFLLSPRLVADDVYFELPVGQLEFPEGPLPQFERGAFMRWNWYEFMQPYAVLDGPGEVYLAPDTNPPWQPNAAGWERNIHVRTAAQGSMSGRIFAPKADGRGFTSTKFKTTASGAKPEARQHFYEARAAYYRDLLGRELPGGAWFRRQEQQSLNESPGQTNRPGATQNFNGRRQDDLESAYDLFSGGRAVSENLQLDRFVRPTVAEMASVELSTLSGITVQEMDWKALIKDAQPELDPLASCIPADQHAVFFASFRAMTDLMDQADFHGTPALELLEPRAEDAKTRQRYQGQLCLDLSELSRLVGPYVIDSVAFTGSDPYLRTGSDVGVLYATKNPGTLKAFVITKQTTALSRDPAAKAVKGEVEGVPYTGVVTPDRGLSSYVAASSNVVFVSNSPFQLAQMIKAAQGTIPAMASLNEYRFFRSRYDRGQKDESALLVLTDAAIRRWCGPRWRIMSARRTQVAGVMADLQAAHLTELEKGQLQPGSVPTPRGIPDAGAFGLTTNGVVSEVYGTLDFLTPIAEIAVTKVSPSEADAYNQWRNRYQQYWRQYFDPIAIRFSVRQSQIEADATVMPLIAGTDYRELIDITRGAKINRLAGDLHTNTLIHVALGVNSQARQITSIGSFLPNDSPIKANPLSWLGQSIAVYLEDDPVWEELQKLDRDPGFNEITRLPLALWCEVKNPLSVGVFLTALRGLSDSSAPGMMVWENLTYNGQTYVKISPARRSDGQNVGIPESLAIYYWVKPEFLLLTLNEPLLKRAIDRRANPAKPGDQAASSALPPWLGESLCLHAEQRALHVIRSLSRDEMSHTVQRLSWNNLPILNEWHRLYPTQDPIQLHERLWHVKLVCPAGGSYVWNDKFQTMESTVCGCPAEPKTVPVDRFVLPGIGAANFGLTFENNGLRAKVIFDQEQSAAK